MASEISKIYGSIVEAKTQDEADQKLKALVGLIVKEGKSPRAAKKIAKANIGFYAGYYDEETARRVWKLYRTRHPVFGKRWPKYDEAVHLGMKMARKA